MNKGYFSVRYTRDLRRRGVWREITQFIQKYVPRDAAVLELGAGYCDFINSVRAREKHAVDINPDLGRHSNPDVSTHIADLTKFRIAKRFDVIFASNVFEHFNDGELEKIMRSVKLMLKPEGRLILMQPNYAFAFREYFDDYTHKKVFSHVSLCDFLKAHGLRVVKCIPRFVPFSFKSVGLPAPGFLVWLYLRSPFKPLAKQMLVVAENEMV